MIKKGYYILSSNYLNFVLKIVFLCKINEKNIDLFIRNNQTIHVSISI